jgi:hypothetical protein
VPGGGVEQGGEHRPVGRPAVVVGAPHPVRAQREGVQHAEREAAGAAQVAPAGEVADRQPAAQDDVLGRLVGAVVHDDDVVGTPGLAPDGGQALGELLPAVPGDDDGDHLVAGHGGHPVAGHGGEAAAGHGRRPL